MKQPPTPHWTAARQRRLEAVAADPYAPRGSGPAGYHCMRLGWTDWARDRYGKLKEPYREVLTEEGLRVLTDWQAGASGDRTAA